MFIISSFYDQDEDTLVRISNYAQMKFVDCDSSLREILYFLVRKILIMRVKLQSGKTINIPMEEETEYDP